VNDPLYVAAVLVGCVLVAEWLARRTFLAHAGAALIVIVVTAVVANVGLVPTQSNVIYDGVFTYLAPLAIFWLLLRVELRRVLTAGLPLLGLFFIGAAGTVIGVLVGMAVLPDAPFGASSPAIAGMFAATYIGGSANLAAVALHYGVQEQATLYAGVMAVDAGLTAVWMAATIAIPRWLGAAGRRNEDAPRSSERDPDREAIAPIDLALLLALGLAALHVSGLVARLCASLGLEVPSMIVLTAIALVLAQVPAVARLAGARALGMFAVYVFLAVIGALCDVAALAGLGEIGLRIAILAGTCIAVHGVIIFGAARLLRLSPVLAAIASQANIGGGTTALALARSLARDDLVLPGVLVGSVGTAIGTFVGFWVVGLFG
jgi:uncharacterized membrane protein